MIIEERAILKEIENDDLQLILSWRNQEPIRKVMFNSDIITWEQHVQWFNRLKKNEIARSKIFYFDNIPYGVLNITQIDILNKRCEWGFYLCSRTAPKGMGTILGYTALKYVFRELNMRKVSAQVFSLNNKSIKFHEKLGFTQEGQLRAHVLKNEQYIDILLFGLLSTEWEKNELLLKELIEGRLT